jgi:uncharacterized lipoprotein YehR (DUF1307 family)
MIFGLFSNKRNGSATAEPPKPPEEDEASFGNIAISLGYCTEDDVKAARQKQTSMRPRIGEILINEKKLTSEQRDEILLRQRVERQIASVEEIHAHNKNQKSKLFSEIREGLSEVDDVRERVGEMLAKKA